MNVSTFDGISLSIFFSCRNNAILMKNSKLDIDLEIHQDEDTVNYKVNCFIYFVEYY